MFLLLVAAQSRAEDHHDVMCALPKMAQKCPIWTEHGYKHQVRAPPAAGVPRAPCPPPRCVSVPGRWPLTRVCLPLSRIGRVPTAHRTWKRRLTLS